MADPSDEILVEETAEDEIPEDEIPEEERVVDGAPKKDIAAAFADIDSLSDEEKRALFS